MSIGIDARLIEETGVGRYIRNLIEELSSIDRENRYVVFLRKKSFDTFVVPNNRWQKRLADVRWHTVKEQFVMSRLFSKEHVDVVHIPYHNPPILYQGNLVITIHDLTILHFDTGKATTLPLPLYKLKRLAYFLELAIGLGRAKRIIAVSNTTKQEIIDHFNIHSSKIAVTYEGVDQVIPPSEPVFDGSYFLYVGNAYPHKNLETLVGAFKKFAVSDTLSARKTKLVLVGNDDFFYKRLRKKIDMMGLNNSIVFFGPGDNTQLASLYRGATALVFPSKMEGFGLPGIEAMAVGTPVVCSNIPVFREIYGDAALMFDPVSADDVADKLKRIALDTKLRSVLILRGKKQAARYSWRRMAQETYKIYEDSVRL